MSMYRPDTPAPSTLGWDFSLLLIRVVTALTLIFFHAYSELIDAWRGVWYEDKWPLLDTVAALGLPAPVAVAATAAIALALACTGLILGLVTRISALVIGVLAAGSLFIAMGSAEAFGAETSVLYLLLAAVLFLRGSGMFGIDAFFARKKDA